MVDALLQATSAGIAAEGTTFIVLRWETVGEAVGYALYRRFETETPDDALRIGGNTPIRVPQSAGELRVIVTEGSPDWLSLATTLTAAKPGATPASGAALVDPAEVFDRGLTETEARFIQAGAQASLTMGLVAGLAFIDTDAAVGVDYRYELRGVRDNDSEFVLTTDVAVQAGFFVLPAPPSGVATQVGDRRVLVAWNRNPYAATYLVERAPAPGGPFLRVNPQPVAYDLDAGIDGTPLPLPQPGFLDVGAWGPDGEPTTRTVDGNLIDGPDTGRAYYYRVASRDTLDRLGAWSAPVSATPQRRLAPMAPDELQVTPTTDALGLAVNWRTVTRNVENHRFVHLGVPDVTQTNFLYRAATREELEDPATLGTHLVATLPSNPINVATPVQTWIDTDPVLRPPYGTKAFFYHVRVADAFGFLSAPSALISAAVPDTTPPGPTDILNAEGEADHIRVEWKLNPEPDVGGYQIYRGVCDYGYIFVPGISRKPQKGEKPHEDEGRSRYRCDMTLVGDVPVGDAASMFQADGVAWFHDFTVPSNSPICYAYWIRAYDHSGNIYPGNRQGCPEPAEYRCASLREKTAPEVPVLTALRARNNGVELEWVAAPEQDLRAFHVYRSESETDPPRFLACILTDGTTSTMPWTGLVPSCAAVPAIADPLTARGSYLDSEAEPHRIYWYRVSALDWLGNESASADLTAIPDETTFTFTSDLPGTPTVNPPVAPATDACGLEVTWEPPFDPALARGFVVFRAGSGPYRQVSGVVTGNGFIDEAARRGVDYHYRVQAVDNVGTLSEPSAPVLHRY